MGKIKYTPAQELAINFPDGNLLLSAAAGSGKTAALTSRIVQLIIEGRAELSQMLVVTFTKAAAGEMKSRISSMLREKIDEYKNSDQQVTSRLSHALTQIPSADISTIHSFLYKSLKPYFPAIGFSQDTTIAEPKDVEKIKVELMRDIVDDFFENGEVIHNGTIENEAFLVLADTIGQARDTTAIDQELLWLAEKLDNMGKNVSVLDEYASELESINVNETDPKITKYGILAIREITLFYLHYRDIFLELEEMFEVEEITLAKYGAALQSILLWLERLGELLSSDDAGFDDIGLHFKQYSPEKLGRLLKKDATETSENFKLFRDEIKKEIGKMTGNYFSETCDKFYIVAEKTAGILRTSAVVLREYKRKLEQKKQSLSIMEYGDLESCALSLFTGENNEPSKAALEIGAKYKYIFVDEYQDTNSVQDEIFRMVGRNSVRFMVGDIKQSIYRFRGADPRVFTHYREAWKKAEVNKYAKALRDDGNSIFMSENFRCSKQIINFINAVSGAILPYGGINYEAADDLVFGSEVKSAPVPVEIALIEKAKSDNETVDVSAEKENIEAKYVAARIKNMIGRYSEDGSKIVQPSDIAILLRSPTTNGGEYRKALEELGIPASTRIVKSLSQYSSTLLLISLLKFIDNPLKDIFAAGAMRSPVFEFEIEDLIRLREIAGELPLYTAVLNEAERDALISDELSKKCKKLTLFLSEEKTLLNGISVEKYLQNLLEKTQVYQIKEIRRNADERDAINKILASANEFDKRNKGINGNKTLSGFIEFLDEYLERNLESDAEGSENAVSIMSIHASKGLEFPICFLCETSKKRNQADESRTILFDDEIGFGMQIPDSTGLVKCDNLIRRTISHKMAEDSICEEMRMLYVALTRAKGKLVVTAKTNSAEDMLAKAQQQCEFLDEYSVKKSGSYIDWILYGVTKNQHCDDWRIFTVYEADIQNEAISVDAECCDELDRAEIERRAESIKENFKLNYRYDYLEKIPSKLVVSRLQPEILDDEAKSEANIVQQNVELIGDNEQKGNSLKKPKFLLEEKKAEANEIGNATHRFLQFVNFMNMKNHGYKSEIERLCENKYISRNDADIINIQHIRKFIQGSLFEKLTASNFVKREFRFNVLVDAAEFTAEDELKEELSKNNVKITVQGVVDCVFRDTESGKLVLLDYKTDSILPDEWRNQEKAEERLRERHKNQLEYYRKICSQMFEEEIEEVYIYSTVLGRCIKM